MFIPLEILVGDRSLSLSTGAAVVIGSDADAGLVVEARGVSRHHGVVSWTGTHWLFTDTDSTNGTYLSGDRVTEVVVDGPVEVRLGHPTDGPQLTMRPMPAATVMASDGGVTPVSTLLVDTRSGTVTIDPPGPALIGRDPVADIRIQVDGVSSRHAELVVEDGAWKLRDLASTYGTFESGVKVEEVVIDRVRTVQLGHPERGETLRLDPDRTQNPAGDNDADPRHSVPKSPRPQVGPPPGATPSSPARSRPGGALEVQQGRSSLLIGNLTGVSQVYRPPTGTVRIGRAPDNDVVVDDLTVSWHHAELRGDAVTGYELADLGSFNGTFVNGDQVERARVQEGDVVSIGHHRLRLIGGTLEEFIDTGDIRFEVSGITVRLPGGVTLLDGISFSLDQRSLMAVVGPSGSGKSTLLNALTGFRPAPEGTVLYDGRDLYASYGDLRQRIGYVPQDDILHTELTVHKALEYAARLRFPPDVDVGLRKQRIEEVIDELGLASRLNVPISALSGGQRKRASVAIELLTKPSLLFLDEPTSGLDPGYERSLTELLRDLADGGRTVVVVTHSVQSLDLCDRMIFLAPGGRTAYFGPPDGAQAYFHADTYAAIFGMLEQGADQDWPGQFSRTDEYRRFVAEPLASHQLEEAATLPSRVDAAPVRRQGWMRQFRTLTSRYLSVIASDRKVVLLLALQAPLLGLLMLATLPPNELQPLGPGEVIRLSSSAVVLAVLIVAVTGLGISNSVREIVKESAVYRRERSVGLSVSAYVASKAVVLSVITGLQAVVLVLIGVLRQGNDWGSALFKPAQLELVAVYVMVGLSAMSLGLLVSAISKSTDRAVSVLPILLILQLVVSGAFKSVVEQPVLREASYLASAQWGFAAAAATVDLNALQSFNDCLAADLSIGSQEDLEELLGCAFIERLGDDEANVLEIENTMVEAGLDRGAAQELIEEVRSARDDVPTVAAGDEPPLRFWDQTPRDWLINMAILGAFTFAGLLGSWWALRRRDPELLSGA